MLTKAEVQRTEEAIREAVRRLPDAQRKEYYTRASARIKDPDTYAVLVWMYVAGLHYFYVGQWGRGAAALFGFLVGVAMCFTEWLGWGIGILLAVTLVELPDLFRSQLIVQDYNNRVGAEILADLAPELLPPELVPPAEVRTETEDEFAPGW